jgi:2-dehydro-3-deoxyphosphogluconate aldolase/(4S)-4-hydroxy-2-oxoglutarate aldolase
MELQRHERYREAFVPAATQPSTNRIAESTLSLVETLKQTLVLPVLTVDDAALAVPLVEALSSGGLVTVEVTLRTPSALAAIARIANELPGVSVGAGTVTTTEEFDRATQAGASFAVSPGLTPALVEAASRSAIPLLPGVGTVGEAMRARDEGFGLLKLFPAAVLGGIHFLKAIRGPLPDLLFCPTGGINVGSYRGYLAEPNVLCVGGSWMVSPELIAKRDWRAVRQAAAEISL